jgi:hypothetical protein
VKVLKGFLFGLAVRSLGPGRLRLAVVKLQHGRF